MGHGNLRTPGKLSAAELARCALIAIGVTGLVALAVIRLVRHFA
jgi:hypothetical protein